MSRGVESASAQNAAELVGNLALERLVRRLNRLHPAQRVLLADRPSRNHGHVFEYQDNWLAGALGVFRSPKLPASARRDFLEEHRRRADVATFRRKIDGF